jgi:maltose alpha-D-glucosyltransferase/alpha-amylase
MAPLTIFGLFLDSAHDRDLQVMIELVVNHTSDQHPWFQAARQAPPGSPERDFYVWSDTDQKYKDARIIFTDTERSNWTWDPVAKQYFWHRFFSHQPDLNYDNPRVVEEILKVMRFWLDMGVDALRWMRSHTWWSATAPVARIFRKRMQSSKSCARKSIRIIPIE